MEYIDTLDKNGNIIEKKSRKQAKKDNDIYRIVYLWIISNNKVLLQQRSYSKKTNPGLWDCAVAGHVQSGETSKEAIIREAKEELNISVDKEKLELIYSKLGYDDKYQFHDVYLLNDEVDLNKIIIQKEEVEQVILAAKEELKKIIEEENFAKDFHNKEIFNIIFNLVK